MGMAASRGLKVALGAGALAVASAVGLYALSSRGPALAPDFAAPDLNGQAVSLASLRGKVVVVNLWTTWCPPCRQEMPSMERLAAHFRGRDFQLLAVSQDEDGREKVAEFARELGLSFPVLLDPKRQVGERFGVWGYPETFVIDRNGYVVERVIGPRDWDSPASIAALEALVASGETPAASASPAPRAPS
jgi:peroxiredoxin